jgi:tetratricopeptide (TPR) repeat protein
LHEKFSEKWPAIVSATQNNELNPMGLIAVLTLLSKTNDLYYLHPSFGYYFEQFYAEPHGLVYKLKILPNDTLLPALPDKKQIAENESFWTSAAEQAFAPIEKAAAPADPNAPRSFGEELLTRFHVTREPNLNAITAGTYYSRDLDFWGVELQRAGELPAAAARFESAGKLNPDNLIARVNLQFNEDLRAGKTVPVDLSKTTADEFGKYRSWNAIIGANGPADQPSFCFQDGVTLMQGGLMRQAVAPFERVRQLDPDNLDARLLLGQLYLASRLPDKALDALHEPLDNPGKFSIAQTNSTQLNILAAGAYLQKNANARAVQLLQTEISRHPADDELLFAVAKAYILHGLFPEALGVIDHKLKMTPDDPTWLFSRGYVSIQLKAYNDAVTAMTRVLSVQTNNNDARFNRAIAYLDSDKLDDARADYLVLQATFTNAPPVAYGLGEIAWRKHETNEAVRNYQIYLANANTNTAEATNIIQRLHELRGQPH